MTWITFLWPMLTAACLTIGLIHLRIGFRRRSGAADLLFALTALLFAAFSTVELALMLSSSAAQYMKLQRWSDFVAAAGAMSLLAFVWVFFGTGRKWLALVGIGVLSGSLILNLTPESGLTFLQIEGLRTIQTLGGASYTVAEGTRNPWVVVFYLGVLLIAVFVADASVTLWRRGGRRRAVKVGGTITFFLVIAGIQAWLVDAGTIATPYLTSFFFLMILAAMGMELSDEVLQTTQLAQDLRESEKQMNLAADAANLGLWIWDVTRDDFWMTPQGRRLLGFSPMERLDRERLLDALHPEDREAVQDALVRTLRGGDDDGWDCRVVLPEGGTRWVDFRGRAEYDDAGAAARVLGVAIDITGRKESEQKIEQQRDELAHVNRISTMDHLASSLAHELSQPLGAILRNAEAAELILQDPSPDLDEMRAILADICKDLERAGDVIDRIRTMMKRREIEDQLLDLGLLACEVAALVRPDAQQRRVRLVLESDPEMPLIQGDRVQLQQVLINLILNAMDALEGEPRATHLVAVRVGAAGDTVEVAVSDTGPGIPADRLPRVFDPFFSSKANGLGMGLAISRGIIEAHRGRLWAENNADGGATFTLALPAAKEGAPGD